MGFTWNDLAERYPEFVAYAVALEGPLPDGDVKQDDYERLKDAYQTEYIGG